MSNFLWFLKILQFDVFEINSSTWGSKTLLQSLPVFYIFPEISRTHIDFMELWFCYSGDKSVFVWIFCVSLNQWGGFNIGVVSRHPDQIQLYWLLTPVSLFDLNQIQLYGRVVWWQLNGQREPNPAENVDICFPTMESCHRRGSQRSRSEIRTKCQLRTSLFSSEHLRMKKKALDISNPFLHFMSSGM